MGSVCAADRQQCVVRVVRHVLADVAVAQLRERVQQAVLLRVYVHGRATTSGSQKINHRGMPGERGVPRIVIDNTTTGREGALVERCATHNLTQQAVLLHMQSHQPVAAG